MKRMRWVSAALCMLLAMLLTACAPAVPAETTMPPAETTTPSAEITAPPATQPVTEPAHTLVALDISGASDSLGGEDICEYPLWQNTKVQPEDDSILKTRTVTVDGVSYTGVYQKSRINIPDTFRSDYYRADGADGKCAFKINAVTGEITEFEYIYPPPEGDMTAEECLSEANRFASQFVDVSQYKLTDIESGENFNAYTYRKYIDGVETAECFTIAVTKTGKGKIFSSGSLGMFTSKNGESIIATAKENGIFSFLCSDQAAQALDEKIRTKYEKSEKYPEGLSSYKVYYEWLIILPDGSLGKYYSVEITVPVVSEQFGKGFTRVTNDFIVKCE